MQRATSDGEFSSAFAEIRSGALIDGGPGDAPPPLQDFAAALPELFADGCSRSMVFRLDDAAAAAGLDDIVLISPRRVHVAQRVPDEPGLALVSVSARTGSIGLILSEARARLARA
jgi:hypothetical protein